MTLSPPTPVQARKRKLFWAWPAFDVLYLAAMFVTATIRTGQVQAPGIEVTVFVLVSWLPLLWRRRFALPVLVVVAFVEALHIAIAVTVGPDPGVNEAMGAFQPVPLATVAAAFTLAAQRPGRPGWVPGAASAVVLLLTGVAVHGQTLIATSFVAFNLVVIAFGAGTLVAVARERTARDERERQAQIRAEVVAERIRIAQDLHDVLAHHLTLVNAQAGVAGYLLRSDPDAASTALQDITGNTRQALDELRATVGMLRHDDERPSEALRPAPGLEHLGELLDGFRSVGADISLRADGDPVKLPASQDLAAYRIIQEAITNATKHAPGAPIAIELHWRRENLAVHITNEPINGRPSGFQGPGTRHGLIGMRERAVTAGGTLTHGPTPAGGFGVRASIPLRHSSESQS
ncbi:sensor histidine kinase [Kineosporia babensis]|uniref:histidine kinase n=1 Tax=Kineosporia babensis TaxID=499548 RepID=A0A9X1NJL9_9ACTN|nr:sensor histidine kinase [Kineosporia babensis]MCD5314779.1 sensor histidine kinase [Kineosporia babensis]